MCFENVFRASLSFQVALSYEVGRVYPESGCKKQTGSWRELPIPSTLAAVVTV